MSESGELFLYGCEVASGERGAAFVAMLQDVTGLKIAAATHKVGHSELGGSWELDVGMPIAQTLRVSAWNGLLATAGAGHDNIQWSAMADHRLWHKTICCHEPCAVQAGIYPLTAESLTLANLSGFIQVTTLLKFVPTVMALLLQMVKR